MAQNLKPTPYRHFSIYPFEGTSTAFIGKFAIIASREAYPDREFGPYLWSDGMLHPTSSRGWFDSVADAQSQIDEFWNGRVV